MDHDTAPYEQFIIYTLALAVAVAVAFFPLAARSGAYTAGSPPPEAPRWSNENHHRNSVVVTPGGCISAPYGTGPDYIPGRDAWGNPVLPADPMTGFRPSLPMGVGVEVELGTKHIGGHKVELYGQPLMFDPNGPSWQRDCLPPQK